MWSKLHNVTPVYITTRTCNCSSFLKKKIFALNSFKGDEDFVYTHSNIAHRKPSLEASVPGLQFIVFFCLVRFP